jgi:rhomboid protease GluP
MLTSIFLHNDIIHLISNLIALLIFGRIVEKEIGFKMIFVFLSSGIIANLISNSISYMQNDLFYSLGASGAIAGLIIFAILLSPFTLTSVLIIPMPIFVIGWAIIILDFIGLTAPSSTNHLAHIGGYSALLFIFFFLELSHRKKIVAGFLINLMLIIVFLMLNSSFNLTSILF